MSLLTMLAALPIALLRLFRAFQLAVTKITKETPMVKSAIVDPNADTEIVPAASTLVPAPLDYPGWLDEFDHQIQALVQLARDGNRIAFNIICDLQAKHAHASDQASQVAQILERPARRSGA
jgi:hypothetical protein